MNTERMPGPTTTMRTDLTLDEVLEATREDLSDPTVTRIATYSMNRQGRRRQAAQARRESKAQRRRK